MNETDAGASVTGCIRSEAPNTRPAASRINSSRLRSGSPCACVTAGTVSSASTKSVRGLGRHGIGVILDERGQRKELRAELETAAPGVLEVDVEPYPAALDVELRHSA